MMHATLLACVLATACGVFSKKTATPVAEQKAVDTLRELTGHLQFRPWRQPQVMERGLPVEELLGHVMDEGESGGISVGAQMWHGTIAGLTDTDQVLSLELTEKSFFEFKPALERLFGLSFSADSSYLVKLEIKWHTIRLEDAQPRLEFLGDEDLYKRPYIQSIAYASHVKIETYIERGVAGKIMLEPLPVASLGTTAELRQTEGHVTQATNVIFGYLPQTGGNWYERYIARYPQVNVNILTPANEQVIKSAKVRVRVGIDDYAALGLHQGSLQIYAWVQRIGSNIGYISPIGAPVDVTNGIFELVTNLGELNEGNGERYSIVVFVLFYKLHNVESRTALQVNTFTRPARDNGRASAVVARSDEIN